MLRPKGSQAENADGAVGAGFAGEGVRVELAAVATDVVARPSRLDVPAPPTRAADDGACGDPAGAATTEATHSNTPATQAPGEAIHCMDRIPMIRVGAEWPGKHTLRLSN